MIRPKTDIILINIGCITLFICIIYALFFAPSGWSLLEKILAGIIFFPCSQALVVLVPNFVWVVILHTKTIRDSRNEEYDV